MEQDNNTQLEELQRKAINVIVTRFDGGKLDKPDKDVDFALRALAAVGRIKATERARDATQYAILNAIAKDRGQFQEMAKVALPQYVPTQLLDKPAKKSSQAKHR